MFLYFLIHLALTMSLPFGGSGCGPSSLDLVLVCNEVGNVQFLRYSTIFEYVYEYVYGYVYQYIRIYMNIITYDYK